MLRKLNIPALLAGPALFVMILFFFRPEGLSESGLAVLACTSWIAVWWITEVVPIPVTSLLPIILFPLTGALSISETTASYGHHLIFLYIGGFILAMAIEKWNLHKRIALNVIRLVGSDSQRIVLGFMLATAFLSMWISNTATSVMMLPIGMAIVMQLQSVDGKNEGFGKALMLGIAYSASIGGMATLIGTPPNLVLAGVVQEYYGFEIVFSRWMLLACPLSLLLLLICWKYLTRFAFRLDRLPGKQSGDEIREQLRKLGKLAFEEKAVLMVFVVTALLWITRSFLLSALLPGLDDTIIAIVAALILFILPAKKEKRILNWETAVKIPWGIVLLFGGGLAIAAGFQSTGLAVWIGSQMSALQGLSLLAVLFVVVGLVNFLTEVTSNTATTSMILPILAPVAIAIGVNPLLLMVGAALAASCAFMLPVATPPNAVVFGSGYLKMSDMVRTGFVLNVISVVIIALYLYFVLPLLWGEELAIFAN